jgi:hypothetical protein
MQLRDLASLIEAICPLTPFTFSKRASEGLIVFLCTAIGELILSLTGGALHIRLSESWTRPHLQTDSRIPITCHFSAYVAAMTNPLPPRHRRGFKIAVICAYRYGKAPGDTNAYTTGVIRRHNVVLAFMPGMGKGSAASVASSFRSSFEGIKLALVVRICGGVPNGSDDEEEKKKGKEEEKEEPLVE